MSKILLRQNEIKENLLKEGKNPHLIPKLSLVSININEKSSDKMKDLGEYLEKISAQKPKVTIAKKSISFLKLREKTQLGFSVTLRKEKAFLFMDKFVFLVLPRIPDFYGFKIKSINLVKDFASITIGIKDRNYFEITQNTVNKQGLWCTIGVKGVKTKEDFISFIEKLTGIPFVGEKNVKK